MRAVVAFALVAAVWCAAGCGGRLPVPARRVIEGDIDGWRFRRYQLVVDVEVYIEGNPARAHTASYVRDAAIRAGSLGAGDVVSAFVTEYKARGGVRQALVRFARRLAQESGYRVEEKHVGGQRVLHVSGHGEGWAFWTSGPYVVKVGGPGSGDVPGGLIGAYGRRYPSELPREALEVGPE